MQDITILSKTFLVELYATPAGSNRMIFNIYLVVGYLGQLMKWINLSYVNKLSWLQFLVRNKQGEALLIADPDNERIMQKKGTTFML